MNISYAQNFEDVMLWRALGHVQDGFYIDIGAQDPLVDSVSLMFHEKGWRGIHVEPTVNYAGLLRQQRPGDKVIQAAVGNTIGVLPLFEIPGTGISTLDPVIAAQHRGRGFDVHETTTPIVPLSAVLSLAEGHDVHWMKIDVEGYEYQVLASWGDSAVRPWVVVVESTLPLTQVQSHDRWEGLLLSKGYKFVYFDGLNRYYVSDQHAQLQQAFVAPPNVFDEFALNGTASASFHALIQQRHEAQLAELRKDLEEQAARTQTEMASLLLTMDVDRRAWAQREQELQRAVSDAQAQLAVVEHALEMSKQEARLSAEREQSLHQQLDLTRGELARAEREASQLYEALSEQLRWAKDALHAQTQVSAEAQTLAQRLVDAHQAQLAELMQRQAQREREMSQQFSAQLDDLCKRLERQTLQARTELQSAQQTHDAKLQALQAKISEQQTHLQDLQAALEGFVAQWSLLESSVVGRLLLRRVQRKSSEHSPGRSLPMSTAPSGTGAASTPPLISASFEMPSTASLDPDQARLEDLLALHDVAFVQEAFHLLLGRAPDPQGLTHYLRQVRQGLDKRHILMDIYSSSECKARLAAQPSLQRFFPGHHAWLWPGIGRLLRRLDGWRSRRDVLRHLRMIDNDLHRHRADVERQLQCLEALWGRGIVNTPEALSSRDAEGGAFLKPEAADQPPASLAAHGRYLYRLLQTRVVQK